MRIEDWEIGALFWKCLQTHGHDRSAADLVREKCLSLAKNDIHFFVGTTLKYHAMRAANPSVIVGLFYPPIDHQAHLF